MSRALGDSLAQSIGVSCDPDISSFFLVLDYCCFREYSRSADDLFIVVASDGVYLILGRETHFTGLGISEE